MAMTSAFNIAITSVYERTFEIIRQPLVNKDMLWILLPCIVTLFLMELYFGRYKEEEMGWNSAVSNSLVLFFVGMNLASWLYSHNMLPGLTHVELSMAREAIIKSIITVFILTESVLFIFLDFFHLTKKKFAFGISSDLIINFVGVISIVLVYSSVALDIVTAISVLFIFICIVIFFWFIHLIEPKVVDLR